MCPDLHAASCSGCPDLRAASCSGSGPPGFSCDVTPLRTLLGSVPTLPCFPSPLRPAPVCSLTAPSYIVYCLTALCCIALRDELDFCALLGVAFSAIEAFLREYL